MLVPGPGRMQFLAVQDRSPCWLTGCQLRGHLNSFSHRLYIQANSSMLYLLVLPIFLASLLFPARENSLLLKDSCNGNRPSWITFISEVWDYNYIVPSWKHLVQKNPRTGILRASQDSAHHNILDKHSAMGSRRQTYSWMLQNSLSQENMGITYTTIR